MGETTFGGRIWALRSVTCCRASATWFWALSWFDLGLADLVGVAAVVGVVARGVRRVEAHLGRR